ncbi:uncharacterized protein J3D65DRAFT_138807 [Phyllosticta citribraziliensis]|uniref:Transmembrane protein n=1 Tax=Phyllosticta citribraziliensis TaxID=989973 RepID=A0ABR1L6G7_9PEZI
MGQVFMGRRRLVGLRFCFWFCFSFSGGSFVAALVVCPWLEGTGRHRTRCGRDAEGTRMVVGSDLGRGSSLRLFFAGREGEGRERDGIGESEREKMCVDGRQSEQSQCMGGATGMRDCRPRVLRLCACACLSIYASVLALSSLLFGARLFLSE